MPTAWGRPPIHLSAVSRQFVIRYLGDLEADTRSSGGCWGVVLSAACNAEFVQTKHSSELRSRLCGVNRAAHNLPDEWAVRTLRAGVLQDDRSNPPPKASPRLTRGASCRCVLGVRILRETAVVLACFLSGESRSFGRGSGRVCLLFFPRANCLRFELRCGRSVASRPPAAPGGESGGGVRVSGGARVTGCLLFTQYESPRPAGRAGRGSGTPPTDRSRRGHAGAAVRGTAPETARGRTKDVHSRVGWKCKFGRDIPKVRAASRLRLRIDS